MSILRKSVRGLMWTAAQSWGGQLVTLVVFTVLARLLTPANFGLVAMANVFLAFTRIFVDQGFTMAIIQRRDLEQSHLSTAFWTNVAIGVALMGLTIAAAVFVAALFDEPELTSIVRWMSIIFLVWSLSAVQQALLRRAFEFKKLAVRTLVSTAAGGVVGITMAVMGYGVWSLVAQQLTGGVVQVLLLWKISDWRPSFNFSIEHFKDLFQFGINIIGINLSEFVNRNADKLLIGKVLGPVALGYYTLAYKLLQTLTRLFNTVSGQVAFSAFSALQEQIERMRHAFYDATQFTALLTIPMFIGLAIIAPQMVVLVFGDQWQPSIPAVQILMLVGILESVYLFNANVMLAMGKPSWRFKLNLVNAFANLIGFLIAIRWGFVAVAAAYVIRAYLLSPIPLYLVRKLIQIDYATYFRNFAGPVVATVVMAIAVYGTTIAMTEKVSPWSALALPILVGIVVYFGAVSIVSPELLKKVFAIMRDRSTQNIVSG